MRQLALDLTQCWSTGREWSSGPSCQHLGLFWWIAASPLSTRRCISSRLRKQCLRVSTAGPCRADYGLWSQLASPTSPAELQVAGAAAGETVHMLARQSAAKDSLPGVPISGISLRDQGLSRKEEHGQDLDFLKAADRSRLRHSGQGCFASRHPVLYWLQVLSPTLHSCLYRYGKRFPACLSLSLCLTRQS